MLCRRVQFLAADSPQQDAAQLGASRTVLHQRVWEVAACAVGEAEAATLLRAAPLEMASFSLKTGTTFMLSRSSTVPQRLSLNSGSVKSLLVTSTCSRLSKYQTQTDPVSTCSSGLATVASTMQGASSSTSTTRLACAACRSIIPKRESYRAMSPLCPAAAAARPAAGKSSLLLKVSTSNAARGLAAPYLAPGA